MDKRFTYLNDDLSFPMPRCEASSPLSQDVFLVNIGIGDDGEPVSYISVEDELYKEHPLGFSVVTG